MNGPAVMFVCASMNPPRIQRSPIPILNTIQRSGLRTWR